MKRELIKDLTVSGFLKRHDLIDLITRRKAEKLLKENLDSTHYKNIGYSYRIKKSGYIEYLNCLLSFLETAEGKLHSKTKIANVGRNKDYSYLNEDLERIKGLTGLDLIVELDKIVLKYKIAPVVLITKIDSKNLTHRNTKFYTLYKTKLEATQKNRDELNMNNTQYEYVLNERKIYYRKK